MGKLLAESRVDHPHDEANLAHPQAVRNLHEEDAPKYGVEVAQNLLTEAKPLVGGTYLMPSASMPYLAGHVIEPVVKS